MEILEDILDNLDIAIFAVNEDGKYLYIYWNDNFKL